MPIVGSVQYERAWVSPTLVRQWLRMHVCVLSYVYSLVLQWYDIVFSRDIYIPKSRTHIPRDNCMSPEHISLHNTASCESQW